MAQRYDDFLPAADKPFDPKQYLRMFWRHRGLVAVGLVLGFCAALIALEFRPTVYVSSVKMMIRDPQLVAREVSGLAGGILEGPAGRNVDAQHLAFMAGRIRSRPFLERVVRALRMTEDPVIRSAAEKLQRKHPEVSREEMAVRILTEAIQSRINFANEGPGIFKVSVADYSAQNARNLARQVSGLFVDLTDQETVDQIKDARLLGLDLVRTYNDRLQRTEEALQRMRQGLIEQDLGWAVIRGDNTASAEALRQRVLEEASDARVRTTSLEGDLSDLGVTASPAILARDGEIDELAQALSTALWNEVVNRLSVDATLPHREWPPQGAHEVHRRNLLRRAEQVAAEVLPSGDIEQNGLLARAIFSLVDAEVQQSIADALSEEVTKYRDRMGRGPREEIQRSRLEAEVEQNRRIVASAEEQIVATDVRSAVESAKLGTQTEILDPATLPLKPSYPNRKKILVMGLFGGLLAGLGLAFLLEMMDPILRYPEDLARVAPEPILGTPPLMSRKHLTHPSRLRRHWAPATMVVVALLTGGFFLMRNQVVPLLAATRAPVQMVTPESTIDDNR